MRLIRSSRVCLLGGLSCVVAAACFTGCGGSTRKEVRPTAGASGEAGEAGSTSNGGSSNGGRAGGSAGSNDLGGAAGDIDAAGATSEAGASGSAGASGEVGSAGSDEAAGAAGVDGCAPPITVTGSRIAIDFDTVNPERVTNFQWLQSPTVTTPNFAAVGGPLVCGDAVEFFGQAYGAESTLPAPVVAGHLATLDRCGADLVISSAGPNDCSDMPQFSVTTRYTPYGGAKADQLHVTRALTLGPTPAYPQTSLRAYVPRMKLGEGFTKVVYPNQANSATTTVDVYGCPNDTVTGCNVPVGTTWNGRWFAEIEPTGNALIVLRDAAPTLPATLAINYDSYSNSNLTAFMLQVTDGWPVLVTESETLCFADLTSWPQTARDAATLPATCVP